jgi:BCD family chlorophyll transporter-like MFS transporter
MSILKDIRLGLLHVAVAITFVLINGVLNRVMIHDLGILASVVAALVVLPYALSPLQVWIGQYSDTHPIFGYRRTPYIALGLLVCLAGTLLTPHAALMMGGNGSPGGGGHGGLALQGVGLGVLAFGLWGFGYNLAVVGYLSLASDLSEEKNRSRTIAVMWFMMIASIIFTAITVSRALEPFSFEQMFQVFYRASLVSLLLAVIGLVGLEPRLRDKSSVPAQSRHSQRAAIQAVVNNPQARLFFVYLILLLAAILGQDVLLEPFGAQAFGMSPSETTQLTAVWGGMTLLALLLYGFVLSRRITKRTGAALGGTIAALGLLMIAMSGILNLEPLFVPGVAALGFGAGIATATNLGLMLDMTTPEQAGLFIGAWGLADALARGVGTLLGGVMRDVVASATGNVESGYISVFLIEALLLCASLILLRQLDIAAFRERRPTLTESVALMGDA